MRYSDCYIPTKRDIAKQDSINAQLLVKAGYVSQVASGVYVFLPLGLRVLNKIEQIIREEMNAIGGNEVLFSALQPRSTWEQSGRWADDNFRQIVYFDQDADMTFGATHEEPMALIVKEKVQSYRDLPVLLYQFQTKFRKELRPKSGLLRGREFRMKDLYSFHPDEESHNVFYEQVAEAYLKIFKRLGLDVYRVKAGGGVFTDVLTDEFQVVCSAGEDEVFVDHSSKTGYNKEVEHLLNGDEKKMFERVQAIEVGNIFHLKTKYSETSGLYYLNAGGERKPAIMGSYGIGVSRLLGTLAEIYHDEEGLTLPEEVAPFRVHLINLSTAEEGEKVYKALTEANVEVLYDDRELPAGVRFVDADTIGLPYRVVVSPKTLSEGKVELCKRSGKETELLTLDEAINRIQPKH